MVWKFVGSIWSMGHEKLNQNVKKDALPLLGIAESFDFF